MKNCLTSKGFDLHPTTCLSSNNKAYKLPPESMPTQFREMDKKIVVPRGPKTWEVKAQ
jgi:hypothetical protein